MKIYCIDHFKTEFDKLKRKKSYSSVEKEMASYFWGKSVEELSTGVRLNNSDTTPYIKKRLGGRGGFRFYFLLIIKDECLYLMFVHPKTGSMGASNIDDKSKAILYKQVLEDIKSNELYELQLDMETEKISFVPTPEKTRIIDGQ